MADRIVFGSYNLTSGRCNISETTEHSLPSHIIQRERVARADGTNIVAIDCNEKMITMSGRIKKRSADYPSFREIEDEFDNSIYKRQRYLRIIREYTPVFNCDSITGWSGGGDTANIAINQANYMTSTSSLSFDADVSASASDYSYVVNSTLTSVNMSGSDVIEQGNFDFWVYLPNASKITSLDFYIGSSASDYYEETGISTNYEGLALENGWNYISIDWASMTKTGSPDCGAINYAKFQVNYLSSAVDIQGILLNGITWTNENEIVNYVATIESVEKPEQHYNIDFIPFTVSFLCSNPFGYGTHYVNALERLTQRSASKDSELFMLGSYNPQPTITYTVQSASGLQEIGYRNNTTNEQITIGTAFAVNDVITINTETLKCLRNASDIDYEGVFPLHIVGNNSVTATFAGTINTVEQTTANEYFSGDAELQRIYQEFQVTTSGELVDVELYLKGTASVSTTHSVQITTINGSGIPATVLASSTVPSVNTGTPAWYTITFSSPPTLSTGTTYALVLQPFKTGSTLYWGDNSSGGYASYDLWAVESGQTLVNEENTATSSSIFFSGSTFAAPNYKAAQTFKLWDATELAVSTVSVTGFKYPSSPDTGTITCRIETVDGSSLPSGTLVSPTATASITNPSDGTYTFTYPTPIELVPTTEYALVFSVGGNCLYALNGTTSGYYVDGGVKTYIPPGPWGAVDKDCQKILINGYKWINETTKDATFRVHTQVPLKFRYSQTINYKKRWL